MFKGCCSYESSIKAESECPHLIGQLVCTLLHVRELITHIRIICHGCWVCWVELVSNWEEWVLLEVWGKLKELDMDKRKTLNNGAHLNNEVSSRF